MTLYDLTGRVALVTGGAAGIGLATARLLGQYGARLAVMDIRAPVLDAAVAGLRAEGIDATGYVGDVKDEAGVDALVDRVHAELGLVDILINNAGSGSHTLPEQVTMAEWRHMFELNLTGSFLMARAVGRKLLAAGKGGAIVNVSSIGASSALGRGNISFSVAKAGMNQMTRELAVEWAGAGIRVNAVQPCQVDTPGFSELANSPGGSELIARMLRGIPLGRLAVSEDVAAAVHFLASDAAAMITGVILPVDGGNLALNPGGTPR